MCQGRVEDDRFHTGSLPHRSALAFPSLCTMARGRGGGRGGGGRGGGGGNGVNPAGLGASLEFSGDQQSLIESMMRAVGGEQREPGGVCGNGADVRYGIRSYGAHTLYVGHHTLGPIEPTRHSGTPIPNIFPTIG